MHKSNIAIIKASLADYPIIQNMARFYVYDRTKYMGWECPETGLYECIDFQHYFNSKAKIAYLIRIKDELAGFVLINKEHLIEAVDWNIGEFFILAKFQSHGIGTRVATEIIKSLPGKWSIAVMPENKKAISFWRKLVTNISYGKYSEVLKLANELSVVEDVDPCSMIIFHFNV
ncbi:MAG: GNAT family N-acetyltransferase [Rickettsiaceae bacterium]|nr:MAG: GNAT family N-acetyltransferase [Rickettsiaceae bacterium]